MKSFLDSNSTLEVYKKEQAIWDKLCIRYYKKRIQRQMRIDVFNIGSMLSGVVAMKKFGVGVGEKIKKEDLYRHLRETIKEEDVSNRYTLFKTLHIAKNHTELCEDMEKNNEGSVKEMNQMIPYELLKLPVLFFSKYAYQMNAHQYKNDYNIFNRETQKRYSEVLVDIEVEKYKSYMGKEKELPDPMDRIFERSPERLVKKNKYMLSRLENISKKANGLFVVKGQKGNMKLNPQSFIGKCKKELVDISLREIEKGDYGFEEYNRLIDMENKLNTFIDQIWRKIVPLANGKKREFTYHNEELILPVSRTKVNLKDLHNYSRSLIEQLTEVKNGRLMSTIEKVNRLSLLDSMIDIYKSTSYGVECGKVAGYLRVLDEYSNEEQLKKLLGNLNPDRQVQEYYFSDLIDIASGNISGMKSKIRKWREESKKMYPGYYRNEEEMTDVFTKYKKIREKSFYNTIDFMPRSYRKRKNFYNTTIADSIEFKLERFCHSILDVLLDSEGVWNGYKKKIRENEIDIKSLLECDKMEEAEEDSDKTPYVPVTIGVNPKSAFQVNTVKKKKSKKTFFGLLKNGLIYTACLMLPFYYISTQLASQYKEKKYEKKIIAKVDYRDVLHSERYSRYFTNKKYDYYKLIYHDKEKLEKEHKVLCDTIEYYDNYKKNDQIIYKVFHNHLKKVLQITNNRRKMYYKKYIVSKKIEYLKKCRDYTKELLYLDLNMKYRADINRLNTNLYYGLSKNDVNLFASQLKKINKYLKE